MHRSRFWGIAIRAILLENFGIYPFNPPFPQIKICGYQAISVLFLGGLGDWGDEVQKTSSSRSLLFNIIPELV